MYQAGATPRSVMSFSLAMRDAECLGFGRRGKGPAPTAMALAGLRSGVPLEPVRQLRAVIALVRELSNQQRERFGVTRDP